MQWGFSLKLIQRIQVIGLKSHKLFNIAKAQTHSKCFITSLNIISLLQTELSNCHNQNLVYQSINGEGQNDSDRTCDYNGDSYTQYILGGTQTNIVFYCFLEGTWS